MNKVLELLERYCQWLAIAVGAVFLGMMVWWYLLFSPVTVLNAGTSLTPGTVDDTVNQNEALPLETAMKREQVDQPPPQHITAIEQFASTLDPKNTETLALRQGWPASIPQDVKLFEAEAPTTQQALVQKLPDVPPSEIVDIKSARAFVLPAANQPNQPAAQPPANGQPAGRDLTYVRFEYRIAPDDIAKSFDAVKIPSQFTNTSIEGITVYREEQLADGSWSASTPVPLIANGVQIQQPPVAGAAAAVIDPFRQWAESQQGQTDLLRPPFYQVSLGEGPWDPPADVVPVVDPEVEKAKRIAAYKQRLEDEKQKRQQAAQSHAGEGGPPTGGPPPGFGGPPGGFGRGGRGGPAPLQWGPSPLQWGQSRPPSVPIPPNLGRPPFMPPDQGDQQGNAPQQAAPGQGQPNASPLPAPVFRPSDTQPFVCWGYDDTVVEGKTYRYQVCYAIRNPLWQSNIVANPAMAQQLLIWSTLDDNAWSQPTYVKPSTEFFLSGPSWASNTPGGVRVQVFKWSQGIWQSKVFTVSPGDEIGGVDGKTDYSTNATVVDVRYDPRMERAYMLVLAPDGKLVEHDPITDRNSPRLQQLNQLIQQAAGANPGGPPNGVPGAPGLPPGIGGPGQPPPG